MSQELPPINLKRGGNGEEGIGPEGLSGEEEDSADPHAENHPGGEIEDPLETSHEIVSNELKDVNDKIAPAMKEMMEGLSPEERERLQEVIDGNMEISDETEGKLAELREKTELLLKKVATNVHYAFPALLAAGGAIQGAQLFESASAASKMPTLEGAVVGGAVGMIVGTFLYMVGDGIKHDYLPFDL